MPEMDLTGMADAMARLQHSMEPLLESTKGYRALAIQRGLPPVVADAAAADFHRLGAAMIAAAIPGVKP